MDRRKFLQGAIAAPLVAAIPQAIADVQTGEVLYPITEPVVADRALLTPEVLAREMARLLGERLTIPVNQTVRGFLKIGDQAKVFGGTPATISHRYNVSYIYRNCDLLLPLDDYSSVYLRPCASGLVRKIEQQAGYVGDSAAVCMVPLEMPEVATFKARAVWRGIHVRTMRDYCPETDETVVRHDILFGITKMHPANAQTELVL